MTESTDGVQAIRWQGGVLQLLDQRLLPLDERWIDCRSAADTAAAIHDMVVRGAPAIGIAAAFGLVLAVHRDPGSFDDAEKVLAASRPTAVNLHWALKRMRAVWTATPDVARLEAEAVEIFNEDLAQNLTMAAFGAELIAPGSRVLTHCNTGALATGGHGTALGVIRTAWLQGRIAEVYNTETRPWLQGARLTAWELMREGIPGQLIADGAAAHLMSTTQIDWVIVGADRIAANGDTANKIGTHMLAVVAKHYGARFMVVAPSGTFDLSLANGGLIPIEERTARELTEFKGAAIAPAGMRAFNPVFDVTPAHLIDAIVCERGVVAPPTTAALKALLG